VLVLRFPGEEKAFDAGSWRLGSITLTVTSEGVVNSCDEVGLSPADLVAMSNVGKSTKLGGYHAGQMGKPPGLGLFTGGLWQVADGPVCSQASASKASSPWPIGPS
jgi:hypothetical protein